LSGKVRPELEYAWLLVQYRRHHNVREALPPRLIHRRVTMVFLESVGGIQGSCSFHPCTCLHGTPVSGIIYFWPLFSSPLSRVWEILPAYHGPRLRRAALDGADECVRPALFARPFGL